MVDSKGLLADLAHDPEDSNTGHFNAHARLVLDAEYGFANLEYVDAPMTEIKGASCRTKSSIPILLPSEWWAETLGFYEHPLRAQDRAVLSHAVPGSQQVASMWTPLQEGHPCRPSITCSRCA